MSSTLFLKNARIIDPAQGLDEVTDLAVKDGRIVGVGNLTEKLDSQENVQNVDGYILTPGLIDCHVHCYQYSTPLGINPDSHCLARGVTAVVDAGSAGISVLPYISCILPHISCRQCRHPPNLM